MDSTSCVVRADIPCDPVHLPARPIPAWSYAELLKKSDLVVVVVPTAIRDANEKDDLPPLKGFEDHAVGVITTFDVLATVKGEPPGKQLVINYYRQIPANVGIGNGPNLVSFEGLLIQELVGD